MGRKRMIVASIWAVWAAAAEQIVADDTVNRTLVFAEQNFLCATTGSVWIDSGITTAVTVKNGDITYRDRMEVRGGAWKFILSDDFGVRSGRNRSAHGSAAGGER